MKHVLVVDDDPWQVEHFERQLEQAGCRVSSASNALAAIEMIDRDRPDVMVLDMMIPGPNGMTLLHELQSHTDLAGLPVIVCSTQSLRVGDLTPYGVVAVLDKSTMTQTDLVAEVIKAG